MDYSVSNVFFGHPLQMLNFIREAVDPQVTRLSGRGSKSKMAEIEKACDRLRFAIIVQTGDKNSPAKVNLKIEQIKEIDLSTIDQMLDAKFEEIDGILKLSIREALNISRFNPVNWIKPTRGPLWGKTTALKEVESALTFPEKLQV